MKTYTLKPLDWKPVSCMDMVADTSIGRYNLYQSGDMWAWYVYYADVSSGIMADHWPTLEAAKAAAEAHYRERMEQGLEVVG